MGPSGLASGMHGGRSACRYKIAKQIMVKMGKVLLTMINIYEVAETNEMIEKENLDVRTITLGISLLDCIDADLEKLNEKLYTKIYEAAKDLVETGEKIPKEYGIPIVNK